MKVGFIGGKFLPLHMGHIYAITKAACMVEELYVVLSHSKKRDQNLCRNSRIDYIPYNIRLRWLSQITKDMENVKVIEVEDHFEDDESYEWHEGAQVIKERIGKTINAVFSSEVGYEPIFKRIYSEAKHIIIDHNRKMHPISATQIRQEGVFKNWNMIPDVVKPHFVKKVLITGTESCGKSTLARYLAKVYNTTYVEEYGRTVCEELGGCDGILTQEDFNLIGYGHKIKEDESARKANKIMFIDTDALVTQYYANLYIDRHSPLFDQIVETQKYDLILFMEPDVKWVDDGLRKHGEDQVRMENNQKLKEMLDTRNIEYVSIQGDYNQRLDQAMSLVDQLLLKF